MFKIPGLGGKGIPPVPQKGAKSVFHPQPKQDTVRNQVEGARDHYKNDGRTVFSTSKQKGGTVARILRKGTEASAQVGKKSSPETLISELERRWIQKAAKEGHPVHVRNRKQF